MRPDPFSLPVQARPLHEELRALAVTGADDAAFPEAGFALLRSRGLVAAPPLGEDGIGALLRLLAEIGRGDLAVGRIYEGHVNALALIARHGSAAQRAALFAEARSGALFGIWNTDQPGDPLRLEAGILRGAKNFASGIDGLARAIVTVTEPDGRRMIVAPLGSVAVDRSWWRPMGMRASGSHIADFSGIEIEPDWLLGGPDAYLEAPWFFAGAIRFVAVHVGGMHGVFDVALEHLRRTGRCGDPYQAQRLARMGAAVESGYLWLDRAAAEWRAVASGAAEPAGLVATVNAARHGVETAALAVLDEAERGVGAAGMIAPHPLERLVRDLRTYLRQPNPDGALAQFGGAVAEGQWTPGRLYREGAE